MPVSTGPIRSTTRRLTSSPPQLLTVEATETGGARGTTSTALATFLGGGTATDNADPNPAHLAPQVNGVDVTSSTFFPLGASSVTFRFEDASGNIGNSTSQVTIVDHTAPVVLPPVSVVVATTEPGGARGAASSALAAFLAAGTASDVADPAPARLSPQLNGTDATLTTLFPIGPSTVTFRFVDASGNVGSATSIVMVASPQVSLAGSGYNSPETPAYRATFSVTATGPLSPSSSVQYAYTRTRMNFVSTGTTSVSVSGHVVTIVGTGAVNGVGGFGFTAAATDGVPDMFALTIRRADGTVFYTAANQALAGGNFGSSIP